MDAWALTDHGNANGHAHARKHFTKLQKSGKKFRQIYGVEFYFVPSLKDWRNDYERVREDAKIAKELSKSKKVDTSLEDDVGGLVLENESESKTVDVSANEYKRRYHLVVLAKNQKGLNNLYTLVKHSYTDGFYKFPRIDFELLKKYGEGLIVSTACLAGFASSKILRGTANKDSDEMIHRELFNMTDRFVDAVGQENFNLEIQFNNLDIQHTVNKYLIEHAKSAGLNLIATADSHYPGPDLWEARELYRKLGWKGFNTDEGNSLPKKEDLKCELYPKNASQMWDEYLIGKSKYDFYNDTDEIVKNAIERTHEIAWDQITDTWIDTKVKLPNFATQDRTAFGQLKDLVLAAMRKEGFDKDQKYIDRVKTELEDIKFLGFENYFLVMKKVFDKAVQKTLLGPGRGSAAGSLVCFLLGITQVDPLKYDLLWERFLGRHRCLEGDTHVKTDKGTKMISQLEVGDNVKTHTGEFKKITEKVEAEHDVAYRIKVRGEDFVCAPNHKWIVERDNARIEIMACELKKGDKLIMEDSLREGKILS